MRRLRVSRRQILRGTAGAAIALPWLAGTHSRAADTDPPKRLVVIYTPNSPANNGWVSGGEDDFVLGQQLAALEPYRSRLLLLSNVDMESAHHGPGDNAHARDLPHLLTGTEIIDGTPMNPGGISVDQYIGQQINAGTKFDQLGFGVGCVDGQPHIFNTLSYTGPQAFAPVEDDPQAAFDRVFAEIGQDEVELSRLRAKRLSVLDAATADANRLRARLGSEDAMRIDQHLETLRSIEESVANIPVLGESCDIPDPSVQLTGNLLDSDNFPALADVQTRLLSMSLACDLSRVAILQFRRALSGDLTFSWLGHNENFHDISHKGDGDQNGQQQLTEIYTWFSERVRDLLDQLDSMPEGDGTVLDNTLVLWMTELAKGNGHTRRGYRWLLAGGGASYFRMGRHLQMNGAWHNDLLVSLCNYMDLPDQTFGNPQWCTGPMAGLV